MAKGAVTELSPDAHITGILTAREIEYAAASVGEAYKPINFITSKKKKITKVTYKPLKLSLYEAQPYGA